MAVRMAEKWGQQKVEWKVEAKAGWMVVHSACYLVVQKVGSLADNWADL